jgi:3',5'-cyclic AMP phosphodiesterase CpdA
MFSVALLIAAAPVAVRWEPLWVAIPGRVGAPEITVPFEPRVPGEQPVVRLAAVGDAGTGDAAERSVAETMAQTGASDPFDALLLLGDNVYPSGDPSRLDAAVFEPFGPVLDAGAELLAVLGNHDVEAGHGPAQAAALGMPHSWYTAEVGPALVIALDTNQVGSTEQRAWLERTLASSDAAWVIVIMHHPPFSAGYHGSTATVREEWVPLFERYGVDLVLTGHDHDYQRSAPIGGITYVVSGGGASPRPTGRAEFTAYSASGLHFVDVAVWEDRIEVQAISPSGVFDTFALPAVIEAGETFAGVAPFTSAMGEDLDLDGPERALEMVAWGLGIWVSARTANRFGWLPTRGRLPQVIIAVSGLGLLVATAGASTAIVLTAA